MNFGTALSGYGKAQPELQQMEQLQAKKQQDAATARVLQQYAQRQQMQGAGQPGQSGQPGQPGQAQQGGFAGGMPPLDKMIDMLSQSGLPADQQFEALKNYGAFASPFERMMSQMEMKQMQMDSQSKLTGERLDMMKTLATINTGSRENIAKDNRQSREDVANKNRTMQYDKMNGVDLRGELNSITQQLTNNPKLTSEQRGDLQGQWQAAKTALDNKRKQQGLGPDKSKAPEVADAAGPTPDPAQLSDKEERSLDGGKTWWRLENGKPVQAE